MRAAFLALVLAAGIAACGERPEPADEVEEGMNVAGQTLGRAASGSEVEIGVGERFTVTLQTIPTAGYVWQVTESPDGLALVGEGVRPTNPELQNQPGFAGGNHWMDFTFEARAPFTGALRMVEARPWELEAGDPPLDEFDLVVTAED
jgi:inhibitor of cysteine peptidase